MSSICAQLKLERDGFVLDANITIPDTGITVLYGPSGAGKSTLLRAIAGLEQASGTVTLGTAVWQDDTCYLPAHERRPGYVFQESSLFEHLSVRANLEYGFKRTAAAAQRIQPEKIIDLLALQNLLDRKPAQLSGGESKRVAIGRALLSNPKLLLMDEPLASLDQQHKRELLPFLERLRTELEIPIIYVTHSADEVARLADFLVLIDKGTINAAGPVNEVLTAFDLPIAYEYDASAIVATEPGVFDAEYGLTPLEFSGGTLLVAGELNTAATIRVRVLARDVSLTLERQTATSILNIVAGQVVELADDGPANMLVKLDANGTTLLARITRRSASSLELAVGKQVWAQIKTVALLYP
jgi:molybdate transport system ATP-binding protein